MRTAREIAEEIVYPENNPMDAFMDAVWKEICDTHPCIGEELESIKFRAESALTQDRAVLLGVIGKLREVLKFMADFSPHCCEDCPCDEFRNKSEQALNDTKEFEWKHPHAKAVEKKLFGHIS